MSMMSVFDEMMVGVPRVVPVAVKRVSKAKAAAAVKPSREEILARAEMDGARYSAWLAGHIVDGLALPEVRVYGAALHLTRETVVSNPWLIIV